MDLTHQVTAKNTHNIHPTTATTPLAVFLFSMGKHQTDLPHHDRTPQHLHTTCQPTSVSPDCAVEPSSHSAPLGILNPYVLTCACVLSTQTWDAAKHMDVPVADMSAAHTELTCSHQPTNFHADQHFLYVHAYIDSLLLPYLMYSGY